VPRTQRSALAVRCRAGAHFTTISARLLGPGSAQQRCTLQRVRDTRECRALVPSGKTPAILSSPPRKNIPLYRNSELRHKSKQPGLTMRGGSRVVRNAGRVAVDAAASARTVKGRADCSPWAQISVWTDGAERVRQNRVVPAVVATVKSW